MIFCDKRLPDIRNVTFSTRKTKTTKESFLEGQRFSIGKWHFLLDVKKHTFLQVKVREFLF